jgi:hypothetical protein
MKICNKCKTELEENVGDMVNHQDIELFGKVYNLCNDCCDDVLMFVKNIKVSEENPTDGVEELFE